MKQDTGVKERGFQPPGGPIKNVPRKVPAEVFADGAKYQKEKLKWWTSKLAEWTGKLAEWTGTPRFDDSAVRFASKYGLSTYRSTSSPPQEVFRSTKKCFRAHFRARFRARFRAHYRARFCANVSAEMFQNRFDDQ